MAGLSLLGVVFGVGYFFYLRQKKICKRSAEMELSFPKMLNTKYTVNIFTLAGVCY